MKILLTGSTGYVGSHIEKALVETGYTVNAPEKAEAVIHCAAVANIPDSFSDPISCYATNVGATLELVEKMEMGKIDKIVFLSTNTVEGNHPYGRSKKMCEQIIQDSGLKYVVMRYFNVAGAGFKGKWRSNYRLIPMLIKAAKTGEPFTLYGGGGQVRDYIHVSDVADITVRALQHLEAGGESYLEEVGSGEGHTIKEVIAMVEQVSGKTINISHIAKRDGDVPFLVAKKSSYNLQHSSLENIVRSTWDMYESI